MPVVSGKGKFDYTNNYNVMNVLCLTYVTCIVGPIDLTTTTITMYTTTTYVYDLRLRPTSTTYIYDLRLRLRLVEPSNVSYSVLRERKKIGSHRHRHRSYRHWPLRGSFLSDVYET